MMPNEGNDFVDLRLVPVFATVESVKVVFHGGSVRARTLSTRSCRCWLASSGIHSSSEYFPATKAMSSTCWSSSKSVSSLTVSLTPRFHPHPIRKTCLATYISGTLDRFLSPTEFATGLRKLSFVKKYMDKVKNKEADYIDLFVGSKSEDKHQVIFIIGTTVHGS